MLAGAMLLWPELYVFSKIMTIPDWANYLPSPVNTGAYLATLSLLPVAWGLARFRQAVKATLLVVLVAPVLPIITHVLTTGPTDYSGQIVLFNYVFVLCISVAAPTLVLLVLRWAWRIWHG